MTPRQFYARHNAEIEREKRQTDLVRLSTYLISGPNLKKGTTLRKFWPVPWDQAKTDFSDRDPKELEKFRERIQKRFKRGNNRGT